MIDANKTPYILAGFGVATAILAWVIKNVFWQPLQDANKKLIEQGNRLVAIETSLKYYFDTTGKGAAIVLDTPNPTPPEMSELLKKHRKGTLTDEERPILTAWLRQVIADPHEAGKRGAALSLLGALGGMERLNA